MIPRAFDDIAVDDLNAIVERRQAEGRSLEYKRDQIGNRDDDKKEFLADLSSLANTQGGDLVIGLADDAGEASSLPGIMLNDPDAEILRLENLMRDGLEPRLGGVRSRWVPLAGSNLGVLIIRVPASVAAPHRVTLAKSARFYIRNSRGKYEMDVHELRQSFLASEGLPRRHRELHEQALRRAGPKGMPFALSGGPRAFVTVAPLNIFRESRYLAVTRQTAAAPPMSQNPSALNELEGVFKYAVAEDGLVRAYALTHRSGHIDFSWIIGRVNNDSPIVWAKALEDALRSAAAAAISVSTAQGMEGPWTIAATLRGIEQFQLSTGDFEGSKPAWRSEATLPALVIDNADIEFLLPLAEAVWLAFGEVRPNGRPWGNSKI